MTAPLALRDVDRHFGPVQVLHGIGVDLRAGEVHALIGENGAGKSTTMKIMCGFLVPTGGEVLVDGRTRRFADQREAEAAGIVMIHQEFNLAEPLTVEENVFLGAELRRGPLLDKRTMRERTAELLDRLDCRVPPTARVRDLSNPDKQMVEIAKALRQEARVLVMDEPTAVLTTAEVDTLLEQVDRLRAAGTAILFTSHKLGEVKQVADRVTVLRDGRVVHRGPADMSEHAMANAMVGRDVSDLYPAKAAPRGEVALRVEELDVPDHAADVSFELRRGEVLGFAGLIGSGRTEAMEGLVGLRPHRGRIEVDGRSVTIRSPRDAMRVGMVYLTEDRKGRGLLLDKGMRENLTLQSLPDFSGLTVDTAAEERALDDAIARFDVRAPMRDVKVGNLSGGNQQKLLLAKTMLADPEIVIIDEPTRGIDIGTKQQIYKLIRELADEGKAVIVVSSEMQEVIGLATRVLVMREGRIVGALEGDQIDEERINGLQMGLGRAAA
ncbi:sugar ABC transporter ATP-binding protein [Hasllibacter halocynthiae]|uniref:sugar ABC transporter ATP-binding protein n=1 Tax=Hasllibacter halocynthiae TaxID=595589 RepID=UPI000D0495ED|nr:sugar ABC transporter ATP-binding protein [Hasllibacter halocynthiae]